jgi:TFIIF-interacting CTD phosphatase-like protein
MNDIDENGFVKHRLYRQHCSPHDDYAIKDLRFLGRDLRRTIIIDNLKENVVFHGSAPLSSYV